MLTTYKISRAVVSREGTHVELTLGGKPYVVSRCRGCMGSIDLRGFFLLYGAQEPILARLNYIHKP